MRPGFTLRALARSLPLSLPLLLTGCIALARLNGDGTSTTPEGIHHIQVGYHPHRVGPYWGPECVRIGAPTNIAYASEPEPEPTMGKQPNLAHDPADQILRLVCVEQVMSDADEPERNTWVMQHFRFDELFFDHLTASMMLVQCLEASSCLDAPQAPRVARQYHNAYAAERMAEQAAAPPKVWQHYEIAMMRWYADHVDPAQVAKRLGELPLPPAAQQAYLRLLDRARTEVVTRSNMLPVAAKHLFLDIPLEVYARRSAEYARLGPQLGELATLTARVKTERAAGTQAVSADTVAQLSKLRIAFHATCKTECSRGPVFAAITRQLFWAHVSRNDAPAAMAEAKLLAKLDPSAAEEIAGLQRTAITAARNRVSRVEAARNQGVDPEAARSTANGSMLDLGDGRYVYEPHDDFVIHWESLVPDGNSLAHIDGKVAALDRRGDQITVRFQDIVSSYEEGTGCYETGRIESSSRDGKINYRSACSGSTTHVERRKVEPVTMPATEAAGLRPGDEVFGFARLDQQQRVAGRVWVVRRGTRLVRLRDVPQ